MMRRFLYGSSKNSRRVKTWKTMEQQQQYLKTYKRTSQHRGRFFSSTLIFASTRVAHKHKSVPPGTMHHTLLAWRTSQAKDCALDIDSKVSTYYTSWNQIFVSFCSPPSFHPGDFLCIMSKNFHTQDRLLLILLSYLRYLSTLPHRSTLK